MSVSQSLESMHMLPSVAQKDSAAVKTKGLEVEIILVSPVQSQGPYKDKEGRQACLSQMRRMSCWKRRSE